MQKDSGGKPLAIGDLVTLSFRVTGINGPNVTLTGQVPDGQPAHSPVLACDARLVQKVGPGPEPAPPASSPLLTPSEHHDG